MMDKNDDMGAYIYVCVRASSSMSVYERACIRGRIRSITIISDIIEVEVSIHSANDENRKD